MSWQIVGVKDSSYMSSLKVHFSVTPNGNLCTLLSNYKFISVSVFVSVFVFENVSVLCAASSISILMPKAFGCCQWLFEKCALHFLSIYLFFRIVMFVRSVLFTSWAGWYVESSKIQIVKVPSAKCCKDYFHWTQIGEHSTQHQYLFARLHWQNLPNIMFSGIFFFFLECVLW